MSNPEPPADHDHQGPGHTHGHAPGDDHGHAHESEHAPAPAPRDAGSQALSEALGSSFFIVQVAMVILLVLIVFSGAFTVGPGEKAIILRFGKPVGEGQKMLLGAGWHWAFPQPIDEVVHIPVTEIQEVTSTAGWYKVTPEQELIGRDPDAKAQLNPLEDGYVLSADRNIIHTRAHVYYRIEDPLTAIFNFASGANQQFNLAGISNAVQNAANNAIIATSARFTVDDILTTRAAEFQDAVGQRVGELVERQHLGVYLDHCNVDTAPPLYLKDIFAQVTTARINRAKLISDAQSEQNRILTEAGATSASITNSAESARVRYVTSVQSEAEAFSRLLPQYQTNPRLFAELELTRALSQVLTNVQDKIFIAQRQDGKSRELRLMLNREPPQSK